MSSAGRLATHQEDVRRLQISVDDAALVGGVDGQGERLDDSGGVAGRLRTAAEMAGEAAAVDVLHREVRPAAVLADIVDLDDVRMLHLGDGLASAAESFQLDRAGSSPARIIFKRDQAIELRCRAL